MDDQYPQPNQNLNQFGNANPNNVLSSSSYSTPQQPPISPNLGMFQRRIGRLGFLLGCVYILLPLIVVIVLQIVGHSMLNSSAANSGIIAPSAKTLSTSSNANTFSKTTVFSSTAANSDTTTTKSLNNTSSYLKLINILSILVGIVTIVFIIPISISLYVRRFHDLNQSGLLTFLTLVPFVGTLVFVYLLFAPGSESVNNYGPPIKSNNFLVVLGLKRPIL